MIYEKNRLSMEEFVKKIIFSVLAVFALLITSGANAKSIKIGTEGAGHRQANRLRKTRHHAGDGGDGK